MSFPCPTDTASPGLLQEVPQSCPGATHVEDSEEHQDGDLEHADLHRDAVPNLDAGEERQLKGQALGLWVRKSQTTEPIPVLTTIFWVTNLLEDKLTQTLTHQRLGSKAQ